MSGGRDRKPLLLQFRNTAYTAGIVIESVTATRSPGQHGFISLPWRCVDVGYDILHGSEDHCHEEIRCASWASPLRSCATYDERHGNFPAAYRLSLAQPRRNGSSVFWNDGGRTALFMTLYVAGVALSPCMTFHFAVRSPASTRSSGLPDGSFHSHRTRSRGEWTFGYQHYGCWAEGARKTGKPCARCGRKSLSRTRGDDRGWALWD
jgi:hypothetical protein